MPDGPPVHSGFRGGQAGMGRPLQELGEARVNEAYLTTKPAQAHRREIVKAEGKNEVGIDFFSVV